MVSNYTGAVATGSTAIPNDDTIPQNTEGDQYLSQAITPTSSANKLLVELIAVASSSVSGETMVGALFQDSIASAKACTIMQVASTGMATIPLAYLAVAGTISTTTFKLRIGGNSGTITFNGSGSARKYGGVFNSGIKITEFMV